MNKLTFFLVFLFVSSLYSMPLKPDLVERLKNEKKLKEIINAGIKAREKGVNIPGVKPKWDFTDGKVNQPMIVILVDFSDNLPDTNDYPPAHYENMLFSIGTYSTGSMRDYYLENSYQKLDVTGEVTPWLRMPHTYSYYTHDSYGFGQYPNNAQRLAEDAVLAADSLIDFSQFDADGDGYVDALAVVHAGAGAEETGSSDDIWSHKWYTSYQVPVDGVYVRYYSMDPENGKIGVFGHELGHVFGLPDLYDYDYDSQGLGMWTMMAAGSWGGGGVRPVHFDAWCKKELGFLNPIVVSDYFLNAPLPQIETDTTVYKLWTLGNQTSQYFLVENREKVGFDRSLPGEGVLIYHVDEEVPNNDNQNHYKVALEQADGRFDLENNSNAGDAGDPFPGSTNNRFFSTNTLPNSRDYDGNDTRVSAWDMGDADSMITMNLAVDYFINIALHSYSFVDTTGDFIYGGDTFGIVCSLENTGFLTEFLDADTVWAIMSSPDTTVTILRDSVFFGSIRSGELAENSSVPFIVTILPSAEIHFSSLTLEMHALPYNFVTYDTIHFIIGKPPIFLVDDDAGKDYESYYKETLDNIGLVYTIWDYSQEGRIGDKFLPYEIVVWFTGDDSSTTLCPEDTNDLKNYLDNGGNLFITGQNIGQDVGGGSFYSNYLHAQFIAPITSEHTAEGVDGDEIGDSVKLLIMGAGYGANNQKSKDVIAPISGADSCILYPKAGNTAGIKWVGDYKVVYFGFGFEGVANRSGYTTREELMTKILEWFGLEVGIKESEIGKRKSEIGIVISPNPFNVSTCIKYHLPTKSKILLKIYDVAGRIVKTLVDEGEVAGNYNIRWNSKGLTSGIYFVKLITGDYKATRKLILVK